MALWRERAVLNKNLGQFDTNKNQTDIHTNGYPAIISRLLINRGFSSDQLDAFLNPKLNLLKDPYLMKDMDLGINRLVKAYKNNEKICIYADFDLDGTSGLAILKKSFEKLGFKNIAYYQPKRLSEGYGFHPHAVEELRHLGISLIITVDVGITSFTAFQKAKELGVDVILTDHHLPVNDDGDEKIPEAIAVINPNQKNCLSGLGYLCGAGVAFYLVRALKRAFFADEELPKNDWDLKEVLDLFCIGTLTDMVPLVEDNRVLVKHGLIALENTLRPGLKILLTKLDLSGRPLTSQDVSIRFAPKLNALSRMESDVLPIHIYLEESAKIAKELVDKMLENNSTRQSLQLDAEKKAIGALDQWHEKDFIFVSSEEFHRGIIGLIATKLANEYNRPAFVGSMNSEGMIVGSSRLPNGFDSNLVEALKSAETYLNRYGGHAAAAGFELLEMNKENLIASLKKFFIEQKNNPKEIELEFDTVAELSEINSTFMKWHDYLGPFGMGFSVPVLKFNRLELSHIKELKGGHLKLTFQDNTTNIDALYFSPPELKKEGIKPGLHYDILGELQTNYFNRKQTIQLLLKDFKVNEK